VEAGGWEGGCVGKWVVGGGWVGPGRAGSQAGRYIVDR
jgi:hypothetical protein